MLLTQLEVDMTVCVALKVHDCIVFAADSASTLSSNVNGTRTVLNVYNNADKVFNLRRDLGIVAMTCGMGHIGGRSISSLAKELRVLITKGEKAVDIETYTVEDIVKIADEFLQEKYLAAAAKNGPEDYLEFWIGGYGSSNDHGEIWKIVLSQGNFQAPVQLNAPDQEADIFWGGQGQAISRLLNGVDPDFEALLVRQGVNDALAGQLGQIVRGAFGLAVISPTMPTIDTIRLAEFLVRTTIGYFSFAFGSDIVGGEPDIATVTKYEGFKWIKRKHFYPQELNVGENGHVC